MKATTKVILSSIATIAMTASVAVGGTLALFTDTSSVSVAVTSGKVDVEAVINETSLATSSRGIVQTPGYFANDATGTKGATFKDGILYLNNITPGDKATFTVDVTNGSNVDIMYRTVVYVESESRLDEYLKCSASADGWTYVEGGAAIAPVEVVVELPETVTYQMLGGVAAYDAQVVVSVEAIQGNGDVSGAVSVATADQLANVLKNAGDEAEVKLTGDVALTESLTIAAGKTVTLDLGKKTLSSTAAAIVNNGTLVIKNGTVESTKENGAEAINNTGDLTIENVTITGAPISATGDYPEYAILSSGNLTINAGTAIQSDRGCIRLSGTGATVINGGTFTNNDISRALTSHVVYVEKNTSHKVTINGGTFKHLDAETSGGVVINNRSSATLDINGGSFSGGNYWAESNLSDYGQGATSKPFSVTGGTFTSFKDKFLADGYVATLANGIYTVGLNVTVEGDSYNSGAVSQNSVLKDANGEVVANSTVSDVMNYVLSNGGNVQLQSDVKDSAKQTNGYGVAMVRQTNGGIIDGNGNAIGTTAWNTWDSAINTSGGTIKNIKVNSGMRGIFFNDLREDLYIDNVIIDGTIYTMNSDQSASGNVYVTNTVLNGWTSYSGNFDSFSFTNCKFGEGNGYAFYRPYSATTLTNCDFAAGFEMEFKANITFVNCTYAGELLDQATFDALVAAGVIVTNGYTITIA